MSKIQVAAISLLVSLSVATPSRAQDALKPGDVISGQLRLVKTRHPNGTPIQAYQIVADTPRMFAEKNEFCEDTPAKTFHLAGMDDKGQEARLKRLIGKKVAVVADEFFCSHTAWHIGDAVVLKWRFSEPGRR